MELAEHNSIVELAEPAVGSRSLYEILTAKVRGFQQPMQPMDEGVWISDMAESVRQLGMRVALRANQVADDFEAMRRAQEVPLVRSVEDADGLRELMRRPPPKRRALPKPLALDE